MPRERLGGIKELSLEYARMVANSEDAHQELSVTLDCVYGKMAQMEAWFEAVNRGLKDHNKNFIQLSRITETCRKKSFAFEQKSWPFGGWVSKESHSSFSSAHGGQDVYDWVWGLGYKLGMHKLQKHFLKNHRADLRSLDSIHPNHATHQVIDSMGRDVMPDAFPPPLALNPWFSIIFLVLVLRCGQLHFFYLKFGSLFTLDWTLSVVRVCILIFVGEQLWLCEWLDINRGDMCLRFSCTNGWEMMFH